MPCGFPVDALSSAFDFVPERDDVILATYPKCGTTWMQNILYMLHNDGREIAADMSVRELVPHLEEMGREFVAGLRRPRLIKTHLAKTDNLFARAAKYVLVFRNPFDCAVSFYHHTRGFTKHYDFADGTFEDFLEVYLAGEVDFGDYFDHVDSWLSVIDSENVHYTTFERMRAGLGDEIELLGRFLGGTAAMTASDRDLREHIVSASSFDSMARDQQRWSSARPTGMTQFVRKGIVGDWRGHFSRQSARALYEKASERLAGTVLLREWADIFAEARGFSEGG
jgi:hypothetical protein